MGSEDIIHGVSACELKFFKMQYHLYYTECNKIYDECLLLYHTLQKQYTCISIYDEVNLLLSFSVASLLSFYVRVYIQPVAVLGSTIVKTSPAGMVRISGLAGYLNDRDGP